jgi:hypothetical protein
MSAPALQLICQEFASTGISGIDGVGAAAKAFVRPKRKRERKRKTMSGRAANLI